MDSDDLIQHYRTMRSAPLAALEGLTAEQLTQTTLDGWSVKDQLNDIVFWDEMRAADMERTHRLIIEALDHATVVGLDPDRYAEPGLFSDHESEHIEWILAWRKRMGY